MENDIACQSRRCGIRFDILMHGLIPLMLAILYPHSRERSREHHQLRWLVRNTVETGTNEPETEETALF